MIGTRSTTTNGQDTPKREYRKRWGIARVTRITAGLGYPRISAHRVTKVKIFLAGCNQRVSPLTRDGATAAGFRFAGATRPPKAGYTVLPISKRHSDVRASSEPSFDPPPIRPRRPVSRGIESRRKLKIINYARGNLRSNGLGAGRRMTDKGERRSPCRPCRVKIIYTSPTERGECSVEGDRRGDDRRGSRVTCTIPFRPARCIG